MPLVTRPGALSCFLLFHLESQSVDCRYPCFPARPRSFPRQSLLWLFQQWLQPASPIKLIELVLTQTDGIPLERPKMIAGRPGLAHGRLPNFLDASRGLPVGCKHADGGFLNHAEARFHFREVPLVFKIKQAIFIQGELVQDFAGVSGYSSGSLKSGSPSAKYTSATPIPIWGEPFGGLDSITAPSLFCFPARYTKKRPPSGKPHLAITPACCLGQRFQPGQRTKDHREINIDACFYQLRGDQQAGLFCVEPPFCFIENGRAVLGTHGGGQVQALFPDPLARCRAS